MSKRNNLTPVKQLALFVKKSKQLSQLSCFDFLSGYKSSFSVSWNQESGMRINNLVKPEENAYHAYLIAFRQFLLTESDTQVNKIINTAIARARHSAFRQRLVELKKDLKEVNNYLHGLKRETPDGEFEISGQDLFDMWLNGTLFHHDVDADELFSSLGMMKDLTEVDFAKYVGLYSNFIIHLSAAIEYGLETNGFDVLNKLSPHLDAKFILKVTEERDKAAVIRFWNGSKQFPQTLAICEEHDQDPVIVVSDFDADSADIGQAKIELKSCCKSAAENALARIHHALAWVDYLEKHGRVKQKEPIEISELPITNADDLKIIKTALDDYRLIWRRKIGGMRCPVHRLPPGARGFGVDLLMQGNGKETNSVFLQGCCLPFIEEFLEKLKMNEG